MPSAERVPFVVIGENVHATRSFARQGKNIVAAGGVERVTFRDITGAERICPIATPVLESTDFARNRVKHIRNALLLGLAGDNVLPPALTGEVAQESAAAGRDYLVAAAVREQGAGAHYIDVNVDEIDADEGIRVQSMEWLVGLLESELRVPLSLDSSSMAVLEAGFRASRTPCGPLLLNSASAERPQALDLAASHGAAAILSAAGKSSLPSNVQGRLDNANTIIADALARGMDPASLHMDLLVLPVAVDAEAGTTYLDAARRFREEHGPEVRITGGLSNVSFGLPSRRLLNDVFVALAVDAGVDSGIVDPLTTQYDRILVMDRDAPRFRLAADVLEGRDAFAMDYLTAYRAGELEEPVNAG